MKHASAKHARRVRTTAGKKSAAVRPSWPGCADSTILALRSAAKATPFASGRRKAPRRLFAIEKRRRSVEVILRLALVLVAAAGLLASGCATQRGGDSAASPP